MKQKGLNVPQLAGKLDVDPKTVGKYLRGSLPGADILAKIATELGVSADYLLGLDGPYVAIPILRPVTKPGGRVEIESSGDATDELHFQASWFPRVKRKRENVCAFEVDAKPLAPGISDGDIVLFDSKDTRAQDGAIYVVLLNQSASVAVFNEEMDGAIVVGEGHASQPKRASPSDARGQLRIQGRVFWRGGRVK